MARDDLVKKAADRFLHTKETMPLYDYLEKAKTDPSLYASPAERLLKAIGDPVLVDTAKESRLGRIFGNRIVKTYPTFSIFYGMEEIIEKIVAFLRFNSQHLEERKQILYLLGPVGSAKSSLAERLKELMEKEPFYAIEGSPILETPLGLFNPEDAEELGIPSRHLVGRISPWLIKRIQELDGDLSKLNVIKLYPSQAKQIAIAKTEPGDENNQDISSLVGKLDIRKLEHFAQDDPDAYRFNGGLCLGNRGILEFVEMFKAPIKVLHPLLTATQEGNYKGTEALSAIPFDGLIIAHSNESEWESFRDNRNNEAFLDRIYIIKVPYCLRVEEEKKIYEKLITNSSLGDAPIAPWTLETLAEFSVLTRLEKPENSEIVIKLKVYDGQNIKEKYPKAKSYQEYKDSATLGEGFSGLSTRAAYKILSKVYNCDVEEIAANPVHMLYVIEKMIISEDMHDKIKSEWLAFVKEYLKKNYLEKIGRDIQEAYLDSYGEYGQHLFDRYLTYADFWIQDQEYRDADTGQLLDRAELDKYLSQLEKQAGIGNPKDFRNEVVNFALRYRSSHKGNNPSWRSYEKLKEVIEKSLFSKTEDLLPQISFDGHAKDEDAKKHKNFVSRMKSKGYTDKQIKLVVEFHTRESKST